MKFSIFKRIKDFVTFYATLLGILTIFVVSGIIEIKPQINTLLLKPVIYVDIVGFKNHYERSTGEAIPSYIQQVIDNYASKDGKYIQIGMPPTDASKMRIFDDGKKLYSLNMLVKEKHFKYELGWDSMPDFWFGAVSDTGLRTLEARRTGAALFILVDLASLPFFGDSWYPSTLQEDIFQYAFETLTTNNDKKNVYKSLVQNRKVYNIISLENRSNQKVSNIILKLNASVPGFKNEVVAWTYSSELINQDTSTAHLTVIKIPYLRPRTSIEFVVRSGHLYKMHDISMEWDRLRNLDTSVMKKYLLILFIASLAVVIIDYTLLTSRTKKRKSAEKHCNKDQE